MRRGDPQRPAGRSAGADSGFLPRGPGRAARGRPDPRQAREPAARCSAPPPAAPADASGPLLPASRPPGAPGDPRPRPAGAAQRAAEGRARAAPSPHPAPARTGGRRWSPTGKQHRRRSPGAREAQTRADARPSSRRRAPDLGPGRPRRGKGSASRAHSGFRDSPGRDAAELHQPLQAGRGR